MTIIVHYVSLENIQNIYEVVVFCCPDVAWGGFLLSFAEDGDHLWVHDLHNTCMSVKTSTRREHLHHELIIPVYFLVGHFGVHNYSCTAPGLLPSYTSKPKRKGSTDHRVRKMLTGEWRSLVFAGEMPQLCRSGTYLSSRSDSRNNMYLILSAWNGLLKSLLGLITLLCSSEKKTCCVCLQSACLNAVQTNKE